MKKKSLVLLALMAVNVHAFASDLSMTPKHVVIIDNGDTYKEEKLEIAKIEAVRLRESLESTYIYHDDGREHKFKACYELTRVYDGQRHQWDYLAYQAYLNVRGTVSGDTIVLNDYFDVYQKHNDDLVDFYRTNPKKRLANAEEHCTSQFYGELLVRGVTKDGRKFNAVMELRFNSHGDNLVELGFGSRNQKMNATGNNSNVHLVAYKDSLTFESQWREADPDNTQIIYKNWKGPKNQ